MFFNGHESMDALGTPMFVRKPLVKVIWSFLNGHTRMDALGTPMFVVLPLVEVN